MKPVPRIVSVGIEGTFEPVSGRDTLLATGHYRSRQWADDFGLVRQLGLAECRYPIPWHRIERERGRYRWTELDLRLNAAAEEHGLTIIADLLHHTSYPAWLDGGFLNPDFPAAYAAFVGAFVARYPQITHFTPFNEPTCTLDFCGYRGFWHPYARGDKAYVTMLRHSARATADAAHRIREQRPHCTILHVDTFQRHAALDSASAARAEHLNERRFVFDELLLGRVGRGHPLYPYLVRHGFSARALAWHEENPVRIDERGGNYYPLNEEQLQDGRTHFAPSREPVGFAHLAREYAERLGIPVSLTETNIQGTPYDRISWLKYMLEETELLARQGIGLRRFAWYPLFDCAGWNSLLQGKRWKRDPQGIFSCDRRWKRQPTAFSELYWSVAAGMGSRQIPAYRFSPRHDHNLGPLKTRMQWDWEEPPKSVGSP